jgi:hypothetical protein
MPPRMWLITTAAIGVGLLSGCESDSGITKPANSQTHQAESDVEAKAAPNPDQTGTVTTKSTVTKSTVTKSTVAKSTVAKSTAAVSAPEPSAQQPVTATMAIRPENTSVGETAEMLVSVRIEPAHYVHAIKNRGEPWIPLAVNLTLPDEVEALGDWELPKPEVGHGAAMVYRNSVLLRRALRIRRKPSARTLRISGELRYQACNEELCWPPRTLPLSATFSIRDQGR